MDENALRERIAGQMRGFMPACVIGAAAELDLWAAISAEGDSLDTLAQKMRCDQRGLSILLDALAAIDLLHKDKDEKYSVPPAVRTLMTDETDESDATMLPMVRHWMSVLRAWSQLAWAVRGGLPAPRTPSIRGAIADRDAFIAGMHSLGRSLAPPLVERLGTLKFKHLLDVGGASGTWTFAFLQAVDGARATIFDLPDAIAQARERVEKEGMADRVDLAPGDFYQDPLPGGVDFAWVSAIIHQHGREENRALFAKVFDALEPGGRIAIRDIVMDENRITPVEGAMFAINMLSCTETGGTFTFDELSEDLSAAGFENSEFLIKDEGMCSVVVAVKPV